MEPPTPRPPRSSSSTSVRETASSSAWGANSSSRTPVYRGRPPRWTPSSTSSERTTTSTSPSSPTDTSTTWAVSALVQDFGYDVDLVLASPNAKWNTTTNQAILTALRNEGGATITWVKRGDSFAFGGASWKILNPAQGTFTASSSVENSSLVYVLEVNGRRALFTGDLKETATAQLAALWGDRGRAHVFLVTHHGSGSGSSSDLLAEITPRFAVISVGATNTFGHPAPATIARLRAQAAKTERIYCTATNGTARATISTSGSISWQTTGQAAPWWSRTGGQTGVCAGQ